MTAKNKTIPWVRLGDYIEECDERNVEGRYTIDDVKGISTDKKFISTKANMDGVSLTSYKVVNPSGFVYVADTSRRGEKIALAHNNTEQSLLVSSVYTVFYIKHGLLPEYLYLLLSRSEFDRYARFNSWGSARETFCWEEMCRVNIPLPSPEVQQELVDTYTGLQRLVEDNEALIAPLSKACQAFIVNCQKKYPTVELGKYIEECDERNTKGRNYSFLGINKGKKFMPTHANTNELDNTKYKIVSKGIFAFSGMQTGRDICIRIALYDKNKPALVSPAYTTFRIKYPKLLSEYLFLQFKRSEMDRYGWYLSDSSVRSNLDWERFNKIQVPLPPLEVQQSIVNLYHCIEEAKKIASEARAQLQTLCPALIQYAEHN